jgi:gliding motility-associated-like protein
MLKRVVLILLFTSVLKLNATHIVGGEIMYKLLNNTSTTVNYEVTMYLYIDCINGNSGAIDIDKDGFFNVYTYNKTTNIYTLYTNFGQYFPLNTSRTGPVRVSDVNYNCIKTKPNACVDKYTFKRTVSLPINTDGYFISFERCCRNNTITNIVNPQSTGATYWTKIPGFLSIGNNSSPVFKSLPPNFLCTNAPLNFDHSAIDPDGDSLVYELYQPFDGASQSQPLPDQFSSTNPANLQQIIWQSGYNTFINQIDGNPSLTINSRTGKLNLTPSAVGQFVIGIKVIEYRNGVFIGETKRDFQFNVSNCVFNIVASFFVPKVNCQNTEVTFTNFSQGSTNYKWDFGDTSSTSNTSAIKTPSHSYKKPGNYNVRLVVSNATDCQDTTDYEVNIKEGFEVKLPNDTLFCGEFSQILESNVNNKSFLWSTGEKTPNITVNAKGLYWLQATDAPCSDRDSIYIKNDLSFLDLGPDSVICRDSFVQFTYPGPDGYMQYLWNDLTQKQSVFISQLGTYWVDVVNKNGCPSQDSITFVLYPPPKTLLNDTMFCKTTSVELNGSNISPKTSFETKYFWSSGEKTPKITTFNPGTYIVKVQNRLCTIFDTVNLKHIETGLDLGPDTFFCGPVYKWIIPQKGFVKYTWHDFAETIDYLATTPGMKKLTIVSREGCIESDSIYISQYPAIDAGLGNDTTICISALVEIVASDSFVKYSWNTGADTRNIQISDSGLYIVTVTDKNGCIISDSIKISEKSDALPIDLFMPNAFTPNDDFLNETYPGNHYSDPGSPYLLRLYNRWGEKIFESESPSIEWDGRIDGKFAPQDVYVYYVKYVGCDNLERWFRGTFTLMR